jgi:hypothetical protein
MMGLALFAGAMAAAATAFVLGMLLLFKAVLWLVLLPFRLLFWTLALPLLLVKLVIGIVGGVLLFALLAVGSVLALVGFFVAILIPLLPLALMFFVIWALVRLMKRPAAA